MTKVRKVRGLSISKDSKKTPILFNDVKYVPGLHCNFLSLSKAMKVFELKGTADQLTLKYKNLRYQLSQNQERIRNFVWFTYYHTYQQQEDPQQ